MNKFVRNLLTEWRKLRLPFENATFVIAVSGGADSVSLAVALNELKTREKLKLRFVIAHYNHRLRSEDSDRDENFVRALAEDFNLELALGAGDISNQPGNLEQNARQFRYGFLARTAGNVNAYAVLTAHTLNDQAETFLLNLIRGSGLDGLGAMKPLGNLEFSDRNLKPEAQNFEINKELAIENSESKVRLVRPLLGWAKREDTENFCRAGEINFRSDAMNEDLKFNRVRIRKILLPLLKDFNPKIVETLAHTASLLREDAEQLADGRRQAENRFALLEENENNEAQQSAASKKSENLSLKELKSVFPSMRRIILREWLETNRGNLRRLELKHIEAIEKLIFSRKSGRVVELPAGETVVKENGELVFQKERLKNDRGQTTIKV